jgi:hypothetical protein
MSTSQTHVLTVATCRLDALCKATLTTMLNNGWNRALTPYMTTQQILSPGELSHLLKNGALPLQTGVISTLKNYAVNRRGAGTGSDISFELNVDLA